MKVLQSEDIAGYVETSLLIVHDTLTIDDIKEISALDIFHEKVYIVLIAEGSLKLDCEWEIDGLQNTFLSVYVFLKSHLCKLILLKALERILLLFLLLGMY